MENNGLHILIVSSWYPSVQHPTYGIFVHEQALLLARKGHHVKVLHIGMTGTFAQSFGNKPKASTESYEEIEVVRMEINPVFPGMRGLNYRKAGKMARQQMKVMYTDRMPDVLHGHALFLGGIIAAHLGRYFTIPFIHTEHTSSLIFTPENYTRTDKAYLKGVYYTAKSVVFVSHFLRDEIEGIYAPICASSIIPNMVASAFFDVERTAERSGKNLVSIGGLLPVKNYSLLISAMALVRDKIPDVRLTIYGDGEQYDALIQQIEAAALKEQIEIKPRLDRPALLEVLKQADMLVSSSKLETFGLTVAEALASGIPVVATDSGGVRDIVSEEVGILCDHSPEGLSSAIIQMLENLENYTTQAIRAYAKKRFHEEIIYNELLSLYPSR